MFIVQVNDNTGVLKELVHMGVDREEAEKKFLGTCDEGCQPKEGRYERLYGRDDVLDDGYLVIRGVGVVMLIDTSNCVSDEELRDALIETLAENQNA